MVDRHNAVVGIITRKDLARMQHNKHGQGFPSSPSSRPPSRRSSVSTSEARPAELATPGCDVIMMATGPDSTSIQMLNNSLVSLAGVLATVLNSSLDVHPAQVPRLC